VNVNYVVGNLTVGMANRWQSHQYPSNPALNVDNRPMIKAYTYTDLNLQYRVRAMGHEFTPFATIENLFNKKPPIVGGSATAPGLYYPAATGFDVIGRYYTLGVRATF
jgi:outer membrane receptor protein involved in Fe transport